MLRATSTLHATRSLPISGIKLRSMIVLAFLALLTPPQASESFERMLERMHRIDQCAWDSSKFLPKSAERLRTVDRVSREESEVLKDHNCDCDVRYTKLTFQSGLAVSFRTFGQPAQTQITGLVISSPRWPVAGGLDVGALEVRVRQVFREPSGVRRTQLTFKGETEPVSFSFKNVRVVAVAFDNYTD